MYAVTIAAVPALIVMSISSTVRPSSRTVGVARLHGVGTAILRYGLVALLLLWGAFKFTAFEAEGIRPLIDHHPLMSWMPSVFGVRGTSAVIGVVELVAAVLMSLRRPFPRLSAIGSLVAAATFTVTLSFLVTTPGVLAPTNPFGGFLMKDIVLLGAAVYTAAEAWAADVSGRGTRR
jgi:uncharacterized membrane protein YkgB